MNAEKQKLAIQICSLKWADIQTGSEMEGSFMEHLFDKLMAMEKEDAIRLLMEVIEAQNLQRDYPESDSPFRDMCDFKYIN